MQHLKKIKLEFCEADFCREKYKVSFLEVAPLRKFLLRGSVKVAGLPPLGKETECCVCVFCGDVSGWGKHRFLGRAGRHDTTKQILFDLKWLFLAVPATKLNNSR